MKIKSKYQICFIAGENVVIACGQKQTCLTRILSLNSNAVWLWQQLEGTDFSEDDVICLLLCRFDIDPSTAISDVRRWIDVLLRHHILES